MIKLTMAETIEEISSLLRPSSMDKKEAKKSTSPIVNRKINHVHKLER